MPNPPPDQDPPGRDHHEVPRKKSARAVALQAAIWLLVLATLPWLAFGVWTGDWRGWQDRLETPPGNTAPDSSDQDGGDAALPSDGDRDLENVPTGEVSVRAPGSAQLSYVAPLADAYRRIDPAADGWQTEAFHEASSKQLERLVRLFENATDDSLPEGLADEQFACSGLYPPSLREVFHDATLRVHRADSLHDVQSEKSPRSNTDVLRGPAGLRAVIEQFRQLYVGGRIDRVKLKPFRVALDNEQSTTTLYFQSHGTTDSGALQINAQWNVHWSTASSELPTLQAIRLEEYEAVEYRAAGGEPLFSDCTKSVLGHEDVYAKQFLRSTDFWRARLPRDLGLDVVANHGIAMGDVNGDQLEDLYVCQQGGLPNRLLLQNPDGTLRDVSVESGADWLDYCASALLVDFDNDGDRDLVVAQEWRILFMSNNGRGQFQLEFGISVEAQSFSLAAADFDQDGDLDVYVCGYNPTASTLRRGAMGEPMPYHDANNGGRNTLLRNDGNWLFHDATSEVGLNQNNSRFSFAAAWEDYDDDGDFDLYVANDYGRNNLYRNDHGKFVDVAAELGVEDMSAGMSANWADVNRDGRMDLYVSNMFSAAGNRITYQRRFKADVGTEVREQFQRHARGNTLFLNTGDGFRDVSEQAGVTMGRWAWGSRFADLNGDGWEDLLVANGFISTEDSGDL